MSNKSLIAEKMTLIALSLGGNQGDVPKNIKKAVKLLEGNGLDKIRMSSLYRTTPVDCQFGTDDFINAAISGIWPYSLSSLFSICKEIELKAGRNLHLAQKNMPRPIDIDILLFGALVFKDKELCIPHSEAKKRLFVLIPLNEIAPELIFPDIGLSVNEILSCFKDCLEYEKIIGNKL